MDAQHTVGRRGIWPRRAVTLVALSGVVIGAAALPVQASTPRCFGKTPTLVAKAGQITNGTNRADVILGTNGPDDIRGRGGNDLICARGGTDRVQGGIGADRLSGGPGADTITGGSGRDLMRGDGGNDTVNSRDGVAERPDGGPGRDLAIVDAGDTPLRFEEVRSPAASQDFNARVGVLADLTQPPESAPRQLGLVQTSGAAGDYVCSVTRYAAAPGYSELFLMDPTTDVIYPGSIIYGDTITTGEYIPLVADRAPMGLSISLENIAGSPARTVNDPKLSTVRTAINDILGSQVTGSTPARVAFSIEEVHSQNQLALSLAANYRNSAAKVAGSFDFSKQDVTSRVIAKFQQVYYTIDMDLPASPEQMFRTLPGVDTLGSASPMYVSTVSYGRQILFTAESSYSKTEVAAALEASFKAAGQSGGANLSVRNSNIINNSTIKAFVLGGSGQDAAAAVVAGVSGLQKLIATGGDYTKTSPGAPLSYKLRYLKNNAIAKIVLASEYDARQCDRVRFNYRVILNRILWDDDGGETGSTAEAYGWMQFRVGDGVWTDLWRKTDSQAQNVPVGGSWPVTGTIAEKTVTLQSPGGGAPPPGLFTVRGRLTEWDPTIFDADDSLGEASRTISRAEVDTTGPPITLNFSGDGNTARVEFRIVPAD